MAEIRSDLEHSTAGARRDACSHGARRVSAEPRRQRLAFKLTLLAAISLALFTSNIVQNIVQYGGNVLNSRLHLAAAAQAEAAGSLSSASGATAATAVIQLNQVGYLPSSVKVALIPAREVADPGVPAVVLPWPPQAYTTSGANPPATNQSSSGSAPAWSGHLEGPVTDPLTGERLYRVDFTSLQLPGRYVLQVGDSAPLRSVPFNIGEDFLTPLFTTVTRSYYLQRCGIALDDSISGFAHSPCHTHDAYLRRGDAFAPANQRLDVTGGWHDAGDYGKYSTTTAITAGQLLLLYELAPAAFPDGQLQIPESGNGVPDLLDEARVGLEWLLRMQRADGAVYHKVGPLIWPGMIRPEKDVAHRYVYGVTSQDTAKAAAAWAMGARLWQPYDPGFARRLLTAARQAWHFLELHPETVDETRPEDNRGSGEYGDRNDADDRYWAAAELYVTTGEAKYGQFLRFTTPMIDWQAVSWTDPSALGVFDFVIGPAPATEDEAVTYVREVARQLILDRAEEDARAAAANPYSLLLSQPDFVWASNKIALARGANLLLAHYLSPHPEWVQIAERQLDWVLGSNPLGKSFITGVGANPVEHPHHRFSAALGKAVPGLLVGGPNSRAEDRVAPAGLGPLSYIDETAAYSVNEPAIDYNAPLVVLVGFLLAGSPTRPD